MIRYGNAGRCLVVALVLACGLLGLARRAEALPIPTVPGFTGNTYVDNGLGVRAFVNYAVAAGATFNDPGAGTFIAGAGSGSLDLNGTTVYAFQVANTENGLPISAIAVEIGGVGLTSWGYFQNTVFVDGSGSVGIGTNLGLGTDLTSPAGPRTGATSVGLAVPLVSSPVVNPQSVEVTIADLTAYFDLSPATEVQAGKTSAVFVYTVLEASTTPTWLLSLAYNGGSNVVGDVPGPIGATQVVPEPATLLLLGPTLVGLVVAYRRKREVM